MVYWIGGQINILEDLGLGSGGRATTITRATARMVSHLIGPNNTWDTHLLKSNLTPSSDIEAIKTLISWNSTIDVFYWPVSKDEIYTVKYVYRRLVDSTTTDPTAPSSSLTIQNDLWKFIWTTVVPSKINHFIWRLCNNILPSICNIQNSFVPYLQF